ncbi:MAG: nicotinate-nucleotide pyrophosphorylase [Alcanivorax borkumensis]|jgi:nicotinate-nucleotide pyrophosphorylase (carboxylating)|uniref:Probable nicotinate-nucleotide pyrophosphorylase [carboxylating] n=1 Tax=Alcanivorax borkumensis (strain ATCC 700651 / DSM 11573 / NCIMB 13689 / SK2) TaxID=393595 RepID=Q0VRY3_ALCBS|nr:MULTISPECIES: carboxylating nicotinate-nucleotide diphosphorylase [Alcanivorax]OJH07951.1 MAG: nicotinate-nucleotide pyrophosphorylase [Alcanivorax borkumensis]CAL16065.1 NAD pyrophosphorylase [Alcanivorax borkumensis SK2]
MTIANLPDYVRDDITRNVTFALEEDIRDGDITAQLIDADSTSSATIITREDTTMCGIPWADEVFKQLGEVDVEWHVRDGDRLSAESTLCTLRGNTRKILTGERTALNFLQTLMGTATTARRYADAVAGSQVTILDTRKTLPGLRAGQKYAVLCGGCQNHRIGLYDAFLIKENHVAACGGITAAIKRARALAPEKKIIVEVETLAELEEAAKLMPDQIMLDNFSVEMLAEAAGMAVESVLEVSGNLTVGNAAELPKSRHWFLSSGALTKHVRAIDLSLRIR